jgi:hypothetical protein
MARIAGLLVFLGFGSVVLYEFTDYQFTLVSWLDDYQPVAGIVMGIVGVALVALPRLLAARGKDGAGTGTGTGM